MPFETLGALHDHQEVLALRSCLDRRSRLHRGVIGGSGHTPAPPSLCASWWTVTGPYYTSILNPKP